MAGRAADRSTKWAGAETRSRNGRGELREQNDRIADIAGSGDDFGVEEHPSPGAVDRLVDDRWAEGSRELAAAIIAASQDAIISKRLDGTILSWNPAAERLFGYRADETVGRKIHLIIPAERRDEEANILRSLRRGQRIDHFETVRLTKDGRRLDVSLTVSPVRNAQGRVIGASKIARDITDRRRTEQALQASEERYRALVESQAEMLCRFRSDGTILYANPAYARALQTTPDALVAGNFWDFIPDSEHAAVREMLGRLTPRSPEIRIENRFTTAEGERWILWTNRALAFDESGRFTEAQSTGIDITELRELAQALRDSDRRKDEFLATLSHELRNPLAPIANSLEVLRQADDDPVRRLQAREAIARQVSHLVRLVDDLLDVSRITRDRLELRRSEVELGSLVRQAVELRRSLPETGERRIEFVVPTQPIRLRADPVRLAQVLNNLINNACKFSASDGLIRVRAEVRGAEAIVSVRDYGAGISAEKLGSIFDMFTHYDPPSACADLSGGLGIGLTLAKRLVELHGGRIEAHSEGAGRGAEFVVHLPLGPQPDTRAVDEPVQAAASPVGGRRKILIVDDNVDNAESLSMLLGLKGHETEVAFDGESALAVAAAFAPDVVLLDIGLPKMNGIEVCRRMRREPWGRAIRIVAVTGWGQDEDRRRSSEAGFDRHLVKPVDYCELEGVLL